MKKVLSALLAAALIFSLAACGMGQHGGDEQGDLPGNAELSEPASDLSEESNVPSPPPRGTKLRMAPKGWRLPFRSWHTAVTPPLQVRFHHPVFLPQDLHPLLLQMQ